MLNKRNIRVVPNNTDLMNTYLYDSSAETAEEVLTDGFLNEACTILKPGDTLKLLKRGLNNEVIAYLEYFIIRSDVELREVEYDLIVKRVYDKEAFKIEKKKAAAE